MALDDGLKFVHFDEYCSTCEHEKVKESEDPCDECLNEPVNQHSHKPMWYKAKEKK